VPEMPVEQIRIRHTDWMVMKEHVNSVFPREACGLVGGRGDLVGKVVPVKNIDDSLHRFRMEPAEQVSALLDLENSGLELLAIYHSHPEGLASPSATDIEEFHYPEAFSLIWSRRSGEWACRAFAYASSGFREVGITILGNDSETQGESEGTARGIAKR
jgi:proteasome lid subunit RPN8/RPN11